MEDRMTQAFLVTGAGLDQVGIQLWAVECFSNNDHSSGPAGWGCPVGCQCPMG